MYFARVVRPTSEEAENVSEENVALGRTLYEAFDRGDIPAILEGLAENVSWNSPTVLPHGGIAHGHEEVTGFFERLADKWEDFQVELRDFVSSADQVCVIGWARGNLGGLPAAYGFVHCLTIADGTVIRFHEYVDPEPAVYAS